MEELLNTAGTILVLALCAGLLWYTVRWVRTNWRQTGRILPPNPYAEKPPGSYEVSSLTTPDVAQNAEQVSNAIATGFTFKLAYANALGRLCDNEWSQIHAQAPDILDRLKKASRGLELGDHVYTEGLLLVTLTAIRNAFGKGQHWLEALVLSDLAIYCHLANRTEDEAWRFRQAQEIASKWLERYPWLEQLCSAKRMQTGKKGRWF